MARTTINANQQTPPRWAGDWMNRDSILPGGARLDAAAFSADSNGRKFVPAGTLVGRTFAERDAGAGFGPVAEADGEITDDEVYLTAFDVSDAARLAEVELYRHNRLVKVNFLPGWSGLSAAEQAKVHELYQTTVGAD